MQPLVENSDTRRVMKGRNPDGSFHTVITATRGTGSDRRLWLSLDGAWQTTAVFTRLESDELVANIRFAWSA